MRKRLKVSIACDTCRSRKVKCNGVRPVCDVCSKRKDGTTTCFYGKDNSQPITHQRPRVRTLGGTRSAETQPRQPNTPEPSSLRIRTLTPNPNGSAPHRMSPPHPVPNSEPHGMSRPLRLSNARNMSLRSEESRRSPWGSPSSSSEPHPEHREVADSMTGVVGEPSESHEFFGSSSAGSFMRQMQHAIDSRLEFCNSRADLEIKKISPSGPNVPKTTFSTKPAIEYVLPPRKTADELADAYWELVYPLYPFLDRSSFETAYESVWIGSDTTTDEWVLICTMNVVFALGTQVSGIVEPENRREKAQIYFNRAECLRENSPCDYGSVNLVSCLLLMGIYLQSANIPQRCWMVVGHAIRVAQSLSLHLPEWNAPTRSQREEEVARRIWHGCILMDRVLAMTFGRPAMIPKWLSIVVPLPKMIDDEFLDIQDGGSLLRPDNKPCLMEFFVSQLKLHDIMDNILLELYMVQDGRQTNADVVTVFKLDEELMNWTCGLSSELQLDAPVDHLGSLRQRLAVVNQVRFLHARMLLLRPILALYCLPPHSAKSVESLSSRMTIQCSSLCLETAHRSIEMIYTHLDLSTVFGPVPAWWYSVLYVYTAATVLLAERIRPEIGVNVNNYSNDVSWSRAIQVLKAYARIGSSAKRCVAALEILSAKIPRAPQFSETLYGDSTCAPPTPFQFDDPEFFSGVEFDNIFLDLNDMGWLHSVPGSLQTGTN